MGAQKFSCLVSITMGDQELSRLASSAHLDTWPKCQCSLSTCTSPCRRCFITKMPILTFPCRRWVAPRLKTFTCPCRRWGATNRNWRGNQSGRGQLHPHLAVGEEEHRGPHSVMAATISSSHWSTGLNMAEVAPAENWCDICQRKTIAPLKSLSTFVLLTLTVNSTRFETPTLSIQGFKPDVCGIGKWESLHLLLTPLNKTVRKHVCQQLK